MKRSDEHHGYEVHSLAISFPLMEKTDKPGFKELVSDIKEHGLQQPIVLDGKMLVDGRNRLSACQEAGVEPRFVQFSEVANGLAPAEYILAHNLHRRHLTEDGRAFIKFAVQQFYTTVDGAEEVQRFPGRFTKGVCPNPAGRKGKDKKQVRTDSCEPVPRDCKAEHARSTVGKLAAEAKVSYAMARDTVKVFNAIQNGLLPKSLEEDIGAGKVKMSDLVKQIPKPDAPAKPPKPERGIRRGQLRDFLAGEFQKLLDTSFVPASHPSVKGFARDMVKLLERCRRSDLPKVLRIFRDLLADDEMSPKPAS